MSLDLTLCPYDWPGRIDWDFFLAYTRLRCGGASGFAERLERSGVTPHPLPPRSRFSWYGDEGLKDYTTDPYGTPLTYLTAAELLSVAPPENERGPSVWAYLKALPPDTPVVLWWH